MCGFYGNKQRIKKEDVAYYKNNRVTIVSATHIKHNKTMDIVYTLDNEDLSQIMVNIPYKTVGFGFELIQRS